VIRLTVLLALVVWFAVGAAGHAAGATPSPEVARALDDLRTDDADKREAAVTVVGQTRDPKWIQFLSALRDGSVYARTRAGRTELVIGGSKATRGDQDVIDIVGAYDREPLGTVPLAELKEVPADRRLRLVIKPFLDADETKGQLADPDPGVRLIRQDDSGKMQEALVAASKRLNDPQLVSLINQFVMVAADVDNDLFQSDKPVDGDGSLMANLCYRVAALYTGLDAVLGMSAGLKHFGTRRLGRSGLADPTQVWDNVFDFDITTFIDTRGSVHSAVFDSPPAIAIVRNILRGVDRNYIAQGVAPYAQTLQPVLAPA